MPAAHSIVTVRTGSFRWSAFHDSRSTALRRCAEFHDPKEADKALKLNGVVSAASRDS